MYPNLKAEMARQGITNEDVAELFGRTRYWADNRLRGKVKLPVKEAIEIRNHFFPGMDLEYLFDQHPLPNEAKEVLPCEA